MTAHFVHEFESHSVDLGCRGFLYEKKTAENVSLSIDNLLHEFNLRLYRDEIPFVIDQGSNLKAALHDNQITHCYWHRLNNILKDTFKKQQNTSAQIPLITHKMSATNKKRKRVSTESVSDGNSSSDDSEESDSDDVTITRNHVNTNKNIHDDVPSSGFTILDMITSFQETTTRWISLYLMLKTINLCYDALAEVLSPIGGLSRLSCINRVILQELIAFLKPFKKVIVDIQHNDATLHKVVPSTWYL
ncbi:unnamed protein product, partial [Didymodactylos carnosus]